MSSGISEKELAFTHVHQLARLIKSRQLSPVELMEVVLKRIKEISPRLNAYLTVLEKEAMAAARKAEQDVMDKKELGILHGLPISIKDLIPTKGIRTTMGSLVYKDWVPESEGTGMQRIRKSGAIIVGKTNAAEIGTAVQTRNKLGDDCRNPWNTERTPGGSSGGAAAAMAAGISPLALGSDGGGSVRIPAAFCGLFGMKPSYGRVPKDYADWGMSHTLTFGPLSWCVRDAAMLLNVLAGPDGLDYTCIRTSPPDFVKALDEETGRLRIAWTPDMGYDVKVNPELKAAVESAAHVFEEMGHHVEQAVPDTGMPFMTFDATIATRNSIPLGFLLDEHPDDIMPYNKLQFETGRSVSGIELAKAWVHVEKIRWAYRDFFQKYDLLLTPTTAVPAFPVGSKDRSLGRGFFDWAFTPFTCIFNLTGSPAASVPCGFSSDGLPLGMQIVGPLEDDITVMRAAAAFEKARPWAAKRPPVS
jgi:Asp-tRNA(Asn)/Glu-tRNA(Gln) amidotransferase A subunit family amidase